MKKILPFLFLFTMLFSSGRFDQMGCAVIHPGGSITIPKGADCVVIDGSKDLIYWVKITAIPFNTGDPQMDRVYNSAPRPLNYVGCDSYKDFASKQTCKLCKEPFWDYEINIGDTVWFLVVANHSDDFCYFTGGGAVKVETVKIGRQDDAGSGRDSSKDAPVKIMPDRVYSGVSAGDRDWYFVRLPRGKLIEFSITYEDGPRGGRPLLYGLTKGGVTENYFAYCTKQGRVIWSQWKDGSQAWKTAFFPDVGETSHCYLKYKKLPNTDPQDQYITLFFFVKPPLQFPPPDEGGKPKQDYKVPKYTFFFKIHGSEEK